MLTPNSQKCSTNWKRRLVSVKRNRCMPGNFYHIPLLHVCSYNSICSQWNTENRTKNMQLNHENQLAKMECYRFGCDEHVPRCQCSDSMQQHYEKNQFETVVRRIEFHFNAIHRHVCFRKKIAIIVHPFKIHQFNFVPLKFSSSFGKLFASHAGVRRTGFAKNGARSTSVLPLSAHGTKLSNKDREWIVYARTSREMHVCEWRLKSVLFVSSSKTPKTLIHWSHSVQCLECNPTHTQLTRNAPIANTLNRLLNQNFVCTHCQPIFALILQTKSFLFIWASSSLLLYLFFTHSVHWRKIWLLIETLPFSFELGIYFCRK